MTDRVFIVGSSLHCSLGKNKTECVNTLETIDNGYEDYLKKTLVEGSYLLSQSYESEIEKLETILTNVIEDALSEANYTKAQKEQMHIFVGSTSMNMGQNEECNQKFLNDENDQVLTNVGYGYVGDMVKKISGSKHSAIGFLTACTSSVNAMIKASKMIKAKKIKRALIVGVELYNKTTYKGFESLMLISRSKLYKPFDKTSDGIILGEGCSAIVLDQEPNAQNCFEILGTSSISDNYSETTTNPDGKIVAKTMDNALKDASIQVKDLDLIKAHATGSENNNLTEAKAVDILFEKYKSSCSVTAVKPFMGHTLGASGTNEIVLIMQTLSQGFIPPTKGFKQKLDGIVFKPLEKKVFLDKATLLCNSVGFGGSNCAVVISNKGL